MQQPPGNQARCGSCGAPDDGELVYCRFCKNAISAQAVQSAIPCPQCRTACRWGKQKCVQCQAWLVVACVFCGAISPHNLPACLSCREPFAGAMQKKQAQMQAAQQQQTMQAVNTYGNVAASFLGAMAGGVAGSAVSHSWFGDNAPHHHHSWNESSSSYDNSTFDPGNYDTSSYDNSAQDNSGGGSSDWSGSSGESDAASAGDAGSSFDTSSSFDSGGGGGDWGGGGDSS
jgi:hypothetical protein